MIFAKRVSKFPAASVIFPPTKPAFRSALKHHQSLQWAQPSDLEPLNNENRDSTHYITVYCTVIEGIQINLKLFKDAMSH